MIRRSFADVSSIRLAMSQSPIPHAWFDELGDTDGESDALKTEYLERWAKAQQQEQPQ